MNTLNDKIIKCLQHSHDSWIGQEGELSRQRYKDGLTDAIEVIETLTKIDECEKEYERELTKNT